MIKAFSDFAKVKGYTEGTQLPKGGYVLKVMGVETCTNSAGDYLKIACDIAEGEHMDHFANDYRAQQSENKKWRCNYLLSLPKDDGSERDGWTKRTFKTFTDALEDSNEGYHFDWDETKFKGKLIGGLFNEREFLKNDGSVGRYINLARITTAENIRQGKYKLPDDKVLDGAARTASTAIDGFVNVPDTDLDELPF